MITKSDAAIALGVNGSFWELPSGKIKFSENYNGVKPTEEEIQAKIIELEAAEPMRKLRQQRNQKLAQSDWMAVSDRIMTAEQISYRQSLRDMPANYPNVALNDAGELINVNWPTEPQ